MLIVLPTGAESNEAPVQLRGRGKSSSGWSRAEPSRGHVEDLDQVVAGDPAKVHVHVLLDKGLHLVLES
jgi:hypothetical protein